MPDKMNVADRTEVYVERDITGEWKTKVIELELAEIADILHGRVLTKIEDSRKLHIELRLKQ